MGFEDRDYYREGRSGGAFFGNIGYWLLYGRVSLFHFRGIHVQAHSSMFVASALMLLMLTGGFRWQDWIIGTFLLFVIVLLHEFGHCFGCRAVGGDADEIVMHPLGGLALVRPPSTWRAHLFTAAAGPLVNVAFCIVCGVALYLMVGQVPWRPLYARPWVQFSTWLDPVWLLFWLFQTNWMLLLFNLMPIYPLDGGQIVQALAWPKFGYYRSMLVSCNVGMVGAVFIGVLGFISGSVTLVLLAVLGYLACSQMKRQLQEAGPYGFSEYDDPFTQSLASSRRADARDSKKARAVAERQAREAERARKARADEAAEIDRILAKVSSSGMHSLTRTEQRTLRDATARQQKQDALRR